MKKLFHLFLPLKRKLNMIRILAFISVLLLSNIANAQPGWQDYTVGYFYTVLDKSGEEINFKNNGDYCIMLDSKLYKPTNIPQETLVVTTENNFNPKIGYLYQIQINDFSLSVPMNNYSESGKAPEIKIIHKNDTIFIRQPSGSGIGMMEWSAIKDTKKEKNVSYPSHFILNFIPGYYYFPYWSKYILDKKAKTTGKVKLVNMNQENFIIPKHLYDLINPDTYRNRNHQNTEADDYVIKNFMNGYISVEKRNKPTKFEKSVLPYKNPRWDTQLNPSKDANRYYGMIGYSADFNNCTSFKSFFSVLNKKENTIEQFFPKDNPRLFGSSKLYVDQFNDMLYLPVITRDEFDFKLSDCENTSLRKEITYRSDDEGITWIEDHRFQKLFDEYEFREFEFLDKDHTLGYIRKRSKRMVQGAYYLLKNWEVIDSLITPDDIYYNSNYNNYRYSVKNDTVFLGSWRNDDSRKYGDTYFQPFMRSSNGQWKFQVEEKILSRPVPDIPTERESIKEYQNFTLINKRELIFKNGSGSLLLKSDIVNKTSEINRGYFILEKGNEIYLINGSYVGHIYMSFDAGTSWFVYPLSLEDKGYQFSHLNIDEKGVISHFSNDRKNEDILHKVFNKFSLE